MQDLDNLKLDADALGVKYHPNIKDADKLQKKIDEHNKTSNPSAVKAPVVDKPVTNYQFYTNTSDINVFTEGGRCHPKGRVELTSDEAKQYKDLELCEK